MVYQYPLATSSWDESEKAALQAVIDSDHYTMGEQVAEFERQFAAYHTSRFAVMSNSGSSANLLMIASLFYTSNENHRLQRGDEIIVPAVSWGTTYFPLCQYGLKVKFVDIDRDTLNFDLQQLKEAISEKTRAILAVNLLGNPNDFAVIKNLIKGKNIILLEDNCESLGAQFQGKMAGSFGLMGTFSSFFSHHISTMEGGLTITDDEELYHIMLSLRAHGWTRQLPKQNKVTGQKSDNTFDESFRFVLPGYNLRPLEMSGALGLVQLGKLPDLVRARRENAALLQQYMANHPDIQIQSEIGCSSWFGFSLLLKPEANIDRDMLLNKLDEIGMESRPIVAGNFTRNSVVKYFDYEVQGELSNANYVDKHGLFVGNHHYDISPALEALANI